MKVSNNRKSILYIVKMVSVAMVFTIFPMHLYSAVSVAQNGMPQSVNNDTKKDGKVEYEKLHFLSPRRLFRDSQTNEFSLINWKSLTALAVVGTVAGVCYWKRDAIASCVKEAYTFLSTSGTSDVSSSKPVIQSKAANAPSKDLSEETCPKRCGCIDPARRAMIERQVKADLDREFGDIDKLIEESRKARAADDARRLSFKRDMAAITAKRNRRLREIHLGPIAQKLNAAQDMIEASRKLVAVPIAKMSSQAVNNSSEVHNDVTNSSFFDMVCSWGLQVFGNVRGSILNARNRSKAIDSLRANSSSVAKKGFKVALASK